MKKYNLIRLLVIFVSMMLSACGGGGGGGGGTALEPVVPVTPTIPEPLIPPALIANPADFETLEYNQNYALGVMNASAAYARGATGEGVLVAVIDSGALTNHVDLLGQIAADSIDMVDQNLPITDTDGHGTNVTGIIAGLKDNSGIHGIAFDSSILAIRTNDRSAGNPAFDDCGDSEGGCAFDETVLAEAVDYAVDKNARIINISLGGGKTSLPALDAALARAAQAGVIIVASAGNDYGLIDDDSNPVTPEVIDPIGLSPDAPSNFAGTTAALGRALAVGATDQNNLIASFSNRAGSGNVRNFYLVAPGVDIITPGLDPDDPASRDTYFQVGGTSFSAAYVSGALALLLDAYPTLQSEDAVALLIETATDLGVTGVDDTYGAGIVNLETAFEPVGLTTASFNGQVAPVALSNIFETPTGAFGDWAEKGGAFVDLLFQDKYQRHFKTDSIAQTIQMTGRGTSLLRSYTDRMDSRYSSDSFMVNSFGKKGLVNISLNQNQSRKNQNGSHRIRQGRSYDQQMFDFDQIEQDSSDTDVKLTMHFGDFHFGSGHGFAAPNSGSLNTSIRLNGGINSLVGEPNWFYGGYDLSKNLTLGFVSNSSDDGSLSAINLERKFGQHSLIGEVGFLNESNNLFGSNLSSRFGENDSGKSLFYAFNWQGPLIGQWVGEGRFELVRGQFNAPDFITVHKQPISSAWAISLHRPVLKESVFNVSISQPLRAESGLISFGVPVDYNLETDSINYADRTLKLTPSGRELDIKSSLYLPLKYGFSLMAEAQYIHNPLHFSSAKNELISWLSLRGSW